MQIYCKHCGGALDNPVKVCPQCGSKVSKKTLKKFKNENQDPIGLGIVIDESGSMMGEETKVKTGVKEFIQEQKKIKGSAELTTIIFSGTNRIVHNKINIQKVDASIYYKPSGSTALNDAIGKIISEMNDYKRAIIAVITDGEENSSTEFTTTTIKGLIEKKEAAGWKFIFMSQGLREDVAQQMASDRGFGAMMSFDKGESKALYMSASLASTDYRTSGSWSYKDATKTADDED